MKKTRILLTPLDWGLGHATRCIPIIKTLQMNNFEVLVGASGDIVQLLMKEFPEITIVTLPGYGIRYSKHGRFFMFLMFLQLPKILFSAWKENRKLKKIVIDYQIDAIISDNRLGCFHKKLPSIYITHQLQLLTGNKLLDRLATRANYFFINQFTECWVPDTEGGINLAGLLSHPIQLPKTPVKYIGLLSRFTFQDSRLVFPLTILISGPEPQRTIFEHLIVEQSENIDLPLFIIRGLPNNDTVLKTTNKKLQYRNHLDAEELSAVLQQSEMIIARSGYSTIMDLMALHKKAILIPTPGQTEQEYLAKKMSNEHLCLAVSQQQFNLKMNIEDAASFQFRNEKFNSSLNEVIEKWKHSFQ